MIEQMGFTISDYFAKDSYGEKQTINVYDGKVNTSEAYFFLRAKDLHDWMMKEFYHGNRIDLIDTDRINANGDGFKNKLKNKEGIYIYIPQDANIFEASGHSGIFTNPPLTKYYFDYPVKNISLWELH